MRDEGFRREQWERRYTPHIEPINRFVDSLIEPPPPQGRGWMPYVAPVHGGVEARVLSLLRDPGPKTLEGSGSGFLSTENDDPTAERMAVLMAKNGFGPEDVLPWNAYPWYVNRSLKASERQAGVGPLLQLIEMLPKLAGVLLQGNDAVDSWRRLLRIAPDIEAERSLTVVASIHPSRSALFVRDAEERARRVERQERAYERVGALLRI